MTESSTYSSDTYSNLDTTYSDDNQEEPIPTPTPILVLPTPTPVLPIPILAPIAPITIAPLEPETRYRPMISDEQMESFKNKIMKNGLVPISVMTDMLNEEFKDDLKHPINHRGIAQLKGFKRRFKKQRLTYKFKRETFYYRSDSDLIYNYFKQRNLKNGNLNQ